VSGIVGRNMGDVVPHAVNADGKEVLKELLTPLFITLAPGFEARADELRVDVTHAEHQASAVACSYIKGSD